MPTLKELRLQGCGVLHLVRILRPGGNTSGSHEGAARGRTAKAAASPEFKAAMEKMDTPIKYLDAPEFQKFWDEDAERLMKAVRNIGKVQ